MVNFDFLSMMGNYEQRKVAHYEKDDLIIDTCAVTDSDEPYETGIEYPKYNNGEWVIVEMYNSKEEAEKGHQKWIEKMTGKNPPKELKDVSTAGIAKLYNKVKQIVKD